MIDDQKNMQKNVNGPETESNMNTNDSVGTNTPLGNEPQVEKESSMGAVVGIIIVIIIIILGGLYFLNQRTSVLDNFDDESDAITPEEILTEEDSAVMKLQEQGNSDEVSDIEADLNNTELESLDIELGDIDSEFSF